LKCFTTMCNMLFDQMRNNQMRNAIMYRVLYDNRKSITNFR